MAEAHPEAFFWRALSKGRQGRKPALFEAQMASSLIEKLLSDQQETWPTVAVLGCTGTLYTFDVN